MKESSTCIQKNMLKEYCTNDKAQKKFKLISPHIYPLKKINSQWNLLKNKREKKLFGPQDLDLLFA